jgi:hypothetical protein
MVGVPGVPGVSAPVRIRLEGGQWMLVHRHSDMQEPED